jgi:L-threonylcarbamoyladenylate synthase
MSSWAIRYAARVLQHNGVIAYPTEAVFGLGCLPAHTSAICRLLELKHRPAAKGLILVASDFSQLQPFLKPVPADIHQRISASWPGPTTWVLPALSGISSLLTGKHHSLAVRVSAHPIVRALCQQTRSALISTSANITGQAMSYTALDVHMHFDNHLDYILNGPLGGSDKPTEIRNALTGEIIRN